MSSYKESRSLEQTPTWAVAVVCFVLVVISIIIEYVLHVIGHWLKKRQKLALYEALDKVKAELMLLGFISLLLTVCQEAISDICIPQSVSDSWHPCSKKEEAKLDAAKKKKPSYGYPDKCPEGKVALVSIKGIHQLHIFIFVLAVTHILYAILTMSLARAKMRAWKAWEIETRTMEYQFSHDPERFRFARNTTFGRRHLSFWSRSTILLWIVCFFRQFFRSVLKIDYLTLRHGFIMAHLAPQSATRFDFQKYIKRSVEDDYKVIVGISPIIWFFAIVFLMSNTHGWFAFLWLPFIPLIIILVIGTKLQVIITKMGLRIQDKGEVVRGVPIVQPNDELFWFGRPRLILSLIHFILFQNAFQLAFFAWTTYEFGLKSCYHEHPADIGIRVSMGIVIQVLCSYVTLPLYALVTQMGSTMKPTIFNERVAVALKKWHHTAKKHTKQGGESASVSPMFSMPSTPTHGNNGTSPVHLLYKHRAETDSADHEHWEDEEIPSPTLSPTYKSRHYYGLSKQESQGQTSIPSATTLEPDMGNNIPRQHEINIGSSRKDFSFDKRTSRGR
ncbi:hypothetical protein ACHQM5_018854 [Ranunculus cassubicifolius]